MKKLLYILLFIATLYACSDAKNNDNILIETTIDSEIVEDNVHENSISPGEFVEYHPNGNIKMKGRYDSNKKRTGLWISYYDNNVKWSESYYVDGKRDGHSLTFFPNGGVRYRGEYKMEQKIGTWTFYNESGEVVKEEKY